MSRIQKADPVARARALRFTLVGSLVCFVLLAWLLYSQEAVVDWMISHMDMLVENSWIPWGFMMVLLLPVIATGVYLAMIGRKVMRAQQYPPPGMTVTRDTEILTGEAAQRRARLLQVGGVVLVLVSVILANLFRLVFLSLFG